MYPHRSGLAIAVPHTGRGVPPQWAWALANLHPPMNLNVIWMNNLTQDGRVLAGEIADIRNYFAQEAIKSNCKYLFFVDEDVVVPPHALRQLIFQLEHHPNISVIGGVYCSKSDPPEPLVFRGNGEGPYWDWKVGEAFQVSGLGMGCTLIRTDIFNQIKSPYFKTVDDAAAHLEGINAIEAWTEDLYFCQKVKDAGGGIMIDSSVLCPHVDLATMKQHRLPADSKPLRGDDGMVPSCLVLGDYWHISMPTPRLHVSMAENSDWRSSEYKLALGSEQFKEILILEPIEKIPPVLLPDIIDEWVRLLVPDGFLRLYIVDDWTQWVRGGNVVAEAMYIGAQERVQVAAESIGCKVVWNEELSTDFLRQGTVLRAGL